MGGGGTVVDACRCRAGPRNPQSVRACVAPRLWGRSDQRNGPLSCGPAAARFHGTVHCEFQYRLQTLRGSLSGYRINLSTTPNRINKNYED